ncbi:polyprenol reductase, putative [Babesia caballi]|uniref:Polyprenol reductase, putative n=1 Tax=Babesia caballi TaxID=5871 RepID=A0AAV4LXS3_BABCB|nr:polyprenol reductase, putative [Babesia caballi]
MVPVIEVLVNAFFVVGGFLCMLSRENELLHEWSTHGKQVALIAPRDSRRKYHYRVSKQLFIHFYVVALVVNAAVFLWVRLSPSLAIQTQELFMRRQFNLFRVLFGVHAARRYVEQLTLFNKIPASHMHFTAYLFGVCYYVVVPFGLCNPTYKLTMLRFVGFAISQYIQFKSHYILYVTKLASTRYGVANYGVPTGGPFNYVMCPHYCSEILVYLSLACNVEIPLDEEVVPGRVLAGRAAHGLHDSALPAVSQARHSARHRARAARSTPAGTPSTERTDSQHNPQLLIPSSSLVSISSDPVVACFPRGNAACPATHLPRRGLPPASRGPRRHSTAGQPSFAAARPRGPGRDTARGTRSAARGRPRAGARSTPCSSPPRSGPRYSARSSCNAPVGRPRDTARRGTHPTPTGRPPASAPPGAARAPEAVQPNGPPESDLLAEGGVDEHRLGRSGAYRRRHGVRFENQLNVVPHARLNALHVSLRQDAARASVRLDGPAHAAAALERHVIPRVHKVHQQPHDARSLALREQRHPEHPSLAAAAALEQRHRGLRRPVDGLEPAVRDDPRLAPDVVLEVPTLQRCF